MTWIELSPGADTAAVQAALQALGVWASPLEAARGEARGLALLPHSARVETERLLQVPGVRQVWSQPSGHPRVDAQAGRGVRVGSLWIGGGAPPVLVAGPCAIESEAQALAAAGQAAQAGARLLRGGAWKPRTSPYAFQGHGREALEWMRRAADAHGLLVVSEVLAPEDAARAAELVDLLQVGSRSMQSFALLRALGATGRPVLLKRGVAASLEEWLLAAEHLLVAGAAGVVFCERGVRGLDPGTRNLLDLGAVALLRHVHGQPVLVDPSHAAGRRDLVLPLARAALGAGADGLLVESHPDPGCALSDGPQALPGEALRALGVELGFAPPGPAIRGAPQ